MQNLYNFLKLPLFTNPFDLKWNLVNGGSVAVRLFHMELAKRSNIGRSSNSQSMIESPILGSRNGAVPSTDVQWQVDARWQLLWSSLINPPPTPTSPTRSCVSIFFLNWLDACLHREIHWMPWNSAPFASALCTLLVPNTLACRPGAHVWEPLTMRALHAPQARCSRRLIKVPGKLKSACSQHDTDHITPRVPMILKYWTNTKYPQNAPKHLQVVLVAFHKFA